MLLNPQALLVCLELATRVEPRWTYAELAAFLGLSASEANAAVDRAVQAGLLTAPLERGEKPRPAAKALVEFTRHGATFGATREQKLALEEVQRRLVGGLDV